MSETEVACLDADWVLPRISLVWNWKSLVSNRWKVPTSYPSSFPVRVCRISGWLLGGLLFFFFYPGAAQFIRQFFASQLCAWPKAADYLFSGTIAAAAAAAQSNTFRST